MLLYSPSNLQHLVCCVNMVFVVSHDSALTETSSWLVEKMDAISQMIKLAPLTYDTIQMVLSDKVLRSTDSPYTALQKRNDVLVHLHDKLNYEGLPQEVDMVMAQIWMRQKTSNFFPVAWSTVFRKTEIK